MTSERQFWMTRVTITVLSEEEPVDALSLERIDYAVTEGDCVLHGREAAVIAVDPAEMARLLDEAGSEPGFFMLTDVGEDEG